MTVDIAMISDGLTESEPGFWVGPERDGLHYDSARSLHWREAEDGSGWHRHRAAVVADVVGAYPPGGPILDVGGGNGFVSRALTEAGMPAVLVEPVNEAVRTAYDRGLRPVVCSTLEAARFRPGTLPAVGMFDVLEHLDDDLGYLRLLRTLLAPGGRLYITVPKHQFLWSAHDVEAGHQRRYSTKALLGVVRRAGYEVEYHTSFFSVLVAPMVVRRFVPGVGGGGGGGGAQKKDGAIVADPTGGSGMAARFIRGALARERRGLRHRTRHLGTSILVVARSGSPTP